MVVGWTVDIRNWSRLRTQRNRDICRIIFKKKTCTPTLLTCQVLYIEYIFSIDFCNLHQLSANVMSSSNSNFRD